MNADRPSAVRPATREEMVAAGIYDPDQEKYASAQRLENGVCYRQVGNSSIFSDDRGATWWAVNENAF